jgi:hypothetical protein
MYSLAFVGLPYANLLAYWLGEHFSAFLIPQYILMPFTMLDWLHTRSLAVTPSENLRPQLEVLNECTPYFPFHQ